VLVSALPEPGELVGGRYRVERELGRGGMSRVYLAVDDRLQRSVALKLIVQGSGEDAVAARSRSEALIGASLSHPQLVTVHDAFVEQTDAGQRTVIVMQHVDGSDLSRAIAVGPLPSSVVARVGADIAAALAHVHALGIVHRDLKPGNIVVPAAPPPFAVLVDFGIARGSDTPSFTAAGTLVGTAAYLSPEQVRGGAVGASSDVYSLGLVLLEALTGRREFDGSDVEAALARTVRDPVLPPSIGTEWSALLSRMLARDPASRPVASEAADALARLRGSHPTADSAFAATASMPAPTVGMPAPTVRMPAAVSPDTAPDPAPSARRRRVPLLIGAAATAVVLVTGGAIALTGLAGEADDAGAPTPNSPVSTSVAPRVTAPSATAVAIEPGATPGEAVDTGTGTRTGTGEKDKHPGNGKNTKQKKNPGNGKPDHAGKKH
jgi:serine/threonine protein kinase